jgi:protein required for attachment to host cells
MTPKYRNLLIVVADGEHVRYVRAAEDGALHSDTAIDSVFAHNRSAELRSGSPGASLHTDARHAETPRHDLHALEKAKFAHAVGRELNQAAANGAFEHLAIAAPSHTLIAIRNALDTATDSKVVGLLTKDLVKTPDDELWPHLRMWVLPVHRPAS